MATRLPTLGPRGEGWLVVQVVLLVAVGLAGLLGPAWDDPARLVTTAVGALSIVAGGLLAVRGVVDLRESMTPLPYPRDDATFVDSGAYAVVRHPIYGGLILGAFGWGLVTASPVAIVLAAALVLFFDLKSRREEVWLVERFAAYETYRARTRRLIPYLY